MTREDRNVQIEKCLGRIRLIAREMRQPLPPGIDVEDLVQEAVKRMAEHLDCGLPWTWLRVQGAMLDFLRQHQTGRRAEMPLDVMSTAEDPEQTALRRERRRILQRNAAALTAKEQAFLRLASHGVTGRRLAQELRVSDRRARQIREAAVARLRAVA